jgi:hypothetical protein
MASFAQLVQEVVAHPGSIKALYFGHEFEPANEPPTGGPDTGYYAAHTLELLFEELRDNYRQYADGNQLATLSLSWTHVKELTDGNQLGLIVVDWTNRRSLIAKTGWIGAGVGLGALRNLCEAYSPPSVAGGAAEPRGSLTFTQGDLFHLSAKLPAVICRWRDR